MVNQSVSLSIFFFFGAVFFKYRFDSMPYKTPNVSSLGSPGVQVDLRGKRSESSIFAERENVHLSWELGFHKGRAARELVFFRPRKLDIYRYCLYLEAADGFFVGSIRFIPDRQTPGDCATRKCWSSDSRASG